MSRSSTQATGTPGAGAWLCKTHRPLEAGYPFHGKYSNMLLMCPDPAGVFVPMLLLTLMFVSVECSVLSTALGHVFINVIVEMAARMGQH